ncbi:hypothetical protein [Primorskyibacter sp. S87]|uniref:hypothetical protein n=1 Tax=Primorskyibacter sp. S87 TaxID=3415126 RepID=UPI003C7AF668
MQERKLLTVRETAQTLRCSESKVRVMFHEGVLDGTKLSDRNIRIFSDSVEGLIGGGGEAA